jgi:hypothetical protein
MPGSASHPGVCAPKRYCMCGKDDSEKMDFDTMQKVFYSISHTSVVNVGAAVQRLTPSARDQLRTALHLCCVCDNKAFTECKECNKWICSFCATAVIFCSSACEEMATGFGKLPSFVF